MALVSAHRGGAGDDHARQNTLAAYEQAVRLGCDFVEFDVRMTRDGTAVLFHSGVVRRDDETWSIGDRSDVDLESLLLPQLDDVLDVLAGRASAHVDLKVPTGEVEVVARVVERLGVGSVVVTTAEDRSVRRLRRWADEHAPGLLVGLSTSARAHRPGWRGWPALVSASFPRLRHRLSGANVVVSHHALARVSMRGYARRRGLPLVVWTVDRPGDLGRWMNDPHTWLVTTNYPQRAFASRR